MLGGMTAISLSAFMPLPLAIGLRRGDYLNCGRTRGLTFNPVAQKPGRAPYDHHHHRRFHPASRGCTTCLGRESPLSPLFYGQRMFVNLDFRRPYIAASDLGACRMRNNGGAFVFIFHPHAHRPLHARVLREPDRGDPVRHQREKHGHVFLMLSAAIGALAGCVISPLTQTHYECGAPLAIKGFTVAILGGLGNTTAAVAAGLLLGVIEAFSISVLPVAFKDVIAIGILLAILFFRHREFSGTRKRDA